MMSDQAIDDSILLTDSASNLSVKDWRISSEDVGIATDGPKWSVVKRVLAGGRQEGVEVIEMDNGLMKFTVVPTRGFQVWTASVGRLRLGWDSPVTEIVHPQFVNLAERGGLGWLNGFGEWISVVAWNRWVRHARTGTGFTRCTVGSTIFQRVTWRCGSNPGRCRG
jgi:hypothetical protein